jgi:hypothetical protein
MKGIDRTQGDETKHWVRVAVGAPAIPALPFAPSFGSAFAEMDLQTTPDLVRDPRLPRLLGEFRGCDWEKVRQAGFYVAKLFRDDRNAMRGEGGTQPVVVVRRFGGLRGFSTGSKTTAQAHVTSRGSSRTKIHPLPGRF